MNISLRMWKRKGCERMGFFPRKHFIIFMVFLMMLFMVPVFTSGQDPIPGDVEEFKNSLEAQEDGCGWFCSLISSRRFSAFFPRFGEGTALGKALAGKAFAGSALAGKAADVPDPEFGKIYYFSLPAGSYSVTRKVPKAGVVLHETSSKLTDAKVDTQATVNVYESP